MNQPHLAIKLYRDARASRSCALCHKEVDLWPGPELFLEGTCDPVCADCGSDQVPDLMDILRIAWRETHCLVIGERGKELSLEDRRALRHGQSDDELASLHDAMVHMPDDEETALSLRLLEQKLVRRGRVDVLLRNGVWQLREDDPEVRDNAIVRAALHRQATVIRLDDLDLPADTLVNTGGPAFRTLRLGELSLRFPTPCAICRRSIEAAVPIFLGHTGELVCQKCVEGYRIDTGGVSQFASPEDEQRFRDGCTKQDVPRIDDGEEYF